MLLTILTHFASPTASAVANCPDTNDVNGTCSTGLPKVNAGSGELHTILTITFGIAAAIAVLMIVIGAMMFVTSGGNPQNATKARETIIFAVVGLVVSLMAEVLVSFVLGKL